MLQRGEKDRAAFGASVCYRIAAYSTQKRSRVDSSLERKSPLGYCYLSFLGDDMQEARKDGCLSVVLEPVLALRCPPTPSCPFFLASSQWIVLTLIQSGLFVFPLKPNLLQRCNSIKAFNQYTRNCTHLSFVEKKKQIGKIMCVTVFASACMLMSVSNPNISNQPKQDWSNALAQS